MSGYAVGAGALLSLAGSATSSYANNQALKKQDNIAADSIRQQAQRESQANAVVQSTVKKTATDQQANLQANQAKQQQAYLAALQRAAPVQNASTPNVSGASKAYADAAASAQTSNAAFGRDQASLLARTDAPQLTQLQTNESLGDAASQLGLIQDQSNREANLAKLREQAVQASPWLNAIGGLASGAGSGLMTYGATRGSGGKKVPGVVDPAAADSGVYASGGQLF